MEIEDRGAGFDPQQAGGGGRVGTGRNARAGRRDWLEFTGGEFPRCRNLHPGRKGFGKDGTGMTAQGEKIKVLIVDDHQVVRQGLRTFLDLHEDIQVVGEAGDGQEAVELAAQLDPGCHPDGPGHARLDGISATGRIKALGLGAKVIALTSFAEDDKVFPAIQAGASSYLLKDVSPDASGGSHPGRPPRGSPPAPGCACAS